METNGVRVGIVGATGLVGSEILSILDEKGFPCSEILVFGTEESRGVRLQWRGDPDALRVDVADGKTLGTCDLVFGAAPEGVGKRLLQSAATGGRFVIDCSPAMRLQDGVPLVVSGVNMSELDENARYIATPGAPVAMIAPIVDMIRRFAIPVAVSGTVFVPVSHRGRAGMGELSAQTVGLLNQSDYPAHVFPERIAFNIHGRVGELPSGANRSEIEVQVERELKKVLDEPDLEVDIFAAQIPAFSGISAFISVLGSESISKEKLVGELESSPGFELISDEDRPTLDRVGQNDDIQVARVRLSSDGRRVGMWLATDNLRRGSALNAVEVAEFLVAEGLIPALRKRSESEKFRTVRLT